MEDYITKQCPHCNQWVYLPKQEFNCKIYRHGILKSNYTQIDPHLPKDICDKLKQNDLIYGCGKPFQIIMSGDKYLIEKCDYI